MQVGAIRPRKGTEAVTGEVLRGKCEAEAKVFRERGIVIKTSVSRSALRTGCLVLLMASALLALPTHGQAVTGKWVAPRRVLDDGEKDRMLLDLHQKGNEITGTAATIGHFYQVEGRMTGVHFELSLLKGGSERKVIGDLMGNQLNLTLDGAVIVAVPAEPEDEYPAIERIDPPALHNVPYNGLAKTPPMGWNSWNQFQSKIDDKTVREVVDAMVASGMRDAGYIYVNIDDTWEGVRDAQGNLTSNKKFPDMKALADYVHSKGMKFGIYSSPGTRTCAEYPGSMSQSQYRY